MAPVQSGQNIHSLFYQTVDTPYGIPVTRVCTDEFSRTFLGKYKRSDKMGKNKNYKFPTQKSFHMAQKYDLIFRPDGGLTPIHTSYFIDTPDPEGKLQQLQDQFKVTMKNIAKHLY